MDKQIGVGIIIGIIVAIAFGIQNYISTRKYRKEKKLRENEIREESQKRYEDKETKTSLLNLYDKGILTEKEYSDKINKIDDLQIKVNLEKTDEFQQLLKLKNSGLLTEEELNEKIQVLKENLKLYINKKDLGRSSKFNQIGDFIEGLAKVWDDENRYGFIDKEDNLVIDTKYEFAEDFSEDLAVVRIWGKFGYINKNDNVVVMIEYDDAKSFKNEIAEVRLGKSTFFIDKNGNKIIKE